MKRRQYSELDTHVSFVTRFLSLKGSYPHLRALIALVAPLAFALALVPNFPHGEAQAKAPAKGTAKALVKPIKSKATLPQAFTSPLAIPPVLTGTNVTLEAREADVQILPGAPTRMWTYNGMFLGPTIHQSTGQTTTVTLVNNLPAAGSLSLHHHGAHTSSSSDGQPATLMVPVGESRIYTYPGTEDGANERGALHWYHDHMMDMTGHHVWMGLAGMYIVDDPADPQTLPSGEFDVPLMVMDRSFDENNQLVYEFDQNGVEGDTMLANGVVQPYFNVGARKYRFRVLNASNFSDLDLELSSGQPLLQIGTESGLLPAPVARQHILLGPAERADIVIDFAGQVGQNIVLRNLAGVDGTAEIMQFRVTQNMVDSSVPPSLRALPDIGTPVITRTFVFGHTNGRWTINGQTYDPNRVDAQPVLGTTERWILQNPLPGEWSHVIHIHLSNQQLISRNGAPPAPYELMKEAWYLNPGDTVELLIKFTDYTGLFVFHCHLLEHEDDSMMAQFEVVSEPPPASSTPAVSATSTRTRTSTPPPTQTPTPGLTPTAQCATPVPTTALVSIVNFAFNPQTTTITQGSSVQWTNTANRNHTSASDNGLWNSGNIGSGQSFTRVFTTVGAFPFHCNIHPAMTGVINVIAAPCATNTATSTATATSTSISTPSATPTGTQSTPTGQTPTLTPSPTFTPIPPSATPPVTLTRTPTSFPSSSATTQATVSATTQPTYTPTRALTASSTAAPPTSTGTSTNTTTATVIRTATAGAGTPTITITPCAASFSDVYLSDYFYTSVRYLACQGAISGYAGGIFGPYYNATRGQISKLVVLAGGWAIDTAGGPHFSDVLPTNPFYPYIETAFNHQLITGYSDGTFRWGNEVSRGQLSKIIVLARQWDNQTTGGPHFSDVPTTDPFYAYIETADNHAVISGYADGTFKPGNNATRGQIAKIIYLAVTSP